MGSFDEQHAVLEGEPAGFGEARAAAGQDWIDEPLLATKP